MIRQRAVLAHNRTAFSLVELLVVLGIILLLAAMTLAGVQRVRGSALQSSCANRLRQIALGLHQYHDANGLLPKGMSYGNGQESMLFLAWSARLTPFLERPDLWDKAMQAFESQPDFRMPPHPIAVYLDIYMCPLDPRSSKAGDIEGWAVGLLSYLGNEGVNQQRCDGVLYVDSRIPFAAVGDGLSNTLMLGERPPSQDAHLGWWYGGTGQWNDGSGDSVLGVREFFRAKYHAGCEFGPHHFRPGQLHEECDFLHFWSLHPGGTNFAFCDGSVRFLAYSADPIMPALATRAGGEAVSSDY